MLDRFEIVLISILVVVLIGCFAAVLYLAFHEAGRTCVCTVPRQPRTTIMWQPAGKIMIPISQIRMVCPEGHEVCEETP